VLLAQVEEWDRPVPMHTVLSGIDSAETAKADFEAGVVRITANEYETALAVAAGRAHATGMIWTALPSPVAVSPSFSGARTLAEEPIPVERSPTDEAHKLELVRGQVRRAAGVLHLRTQMFLHCRGREIP
jgi:hypothetical protein